MLRRVLEIFSHIGAFSRLTATPELFASARALQWATWMYAWNLLTWNRFFFSRKSRIEVNQTESILIHPYVFCKASQKPIPTSSELGYASKCWPCIMLVEHSHVTYRHSQSIAAYADYSYQSNVIKPLPKHLCCEIIAFCSRPRLHIFPHFLPVRRAFYALAMVWEIPRQHNIEQLRAGLSRNAETPHSTCSHCLMHSAVVSNAPEVRGSRPLSNALAASTLERIRVVCFSFDFRFTPKLVASWKHQGTLHL